MKSTNIMGMGFFLIATILYGVKYIAAAIYMAPEITRNDYYFDMGLKYVGTEINSIITFSVIIGICLLVLPPVIGYIKNSTK